MNYRTFNNAEITLDTAQQLVSFGENYLRNARRTAEDAIQGAQTQHSMQIRSAIDQLTKLELEIEATDQQIKQEQQEALQATLSGASFGTGEATAAEKHKMLLEARLEALRGFVPDPDKTITETAEKAQKSYTETVCSTRDRLDAISVWCEETADMLQEIAEDARRAKSITRYALPVLKLDTGKTLEELKTLYAGRDQAEANRLEALKRQAEREKAWDAAEKAEAEKPKNTPDVVTIMGDNGTITAYRRSDGYYYTSAGRRVTV